jgi:hypothetical protein
MFENPSRAFALDGYTLIIKPFPKLSKNKKFPLW